MTDRLLTDYIRDILDAVDKAAQFAPGDDFDSFVADSKTIFAWCVPWKLLARPPSRYRMMFGQNIQVCPGVR